MSGPRRHRPRLLLALLLPLLGHCVVGLDGRRGAERGDGEGKRGRGGKQSKAARDYSQVDPSFKATLEGSMTGGQAQIDAETRIAWDAHGRLESLLQGTRTEECRGEIIKTYQEYLGAQALERALPFEGEKFTSQCKDSSKRPPVPETGLIEKEDVRLAYVILAHDEPEQVVRLVNALDDEPGHNRTWFIIHIDAKADSVHGELTKTFKDRTNVIVMDEGRLDVAWGGFNVVQASLNAVSLALEREIPFHWLWILSGTTYPIASNDEIRAKLSSHHPESIFMESKMTAHKPASTTWHYFVECDSALHRIGRNLPPRGLEMYVGSQWLAMPPSAARWLMKDEKLVPRYRDYAKHIVVADENFLPTMMKNSPFCAHLVASNFVHVQFDRYEHTLDREDRRADKCLMPNPDHCGRSPATMTLDYLSVLEHSGMLFARKFDPKDTDIFQVLDKVRDGEQPWRQGPTFDYVAIQSVTAQDGEGDAGSGQEMCISLPEPSKKMGKRGGSMGSVVTMEKCDEDDARQVFKLGPCSSDGHLALGEGGQGFMKSTRGSVSGRAPSCSVTSALGTCLDLLGEAKEPGAPAISYKCHNRWNQFFNFGEGELAGHLLSTVPSHLSMADGMTGGTLCLEAVTDDQRGSAVKTAECAPDRTTQKFNVVKLYPSTYPGTKTPLKTQGAQTPDMDCEGPEGTCPATK